MQSHVDCPTAAAVLNLYYCVLLNSVEPVLRRTVAYPQPTVGAACYALLPGPLALGNLSLQGPALDIPTGAPASCSGGLMAVVHLVGVAPFALWYTPNRCVFLLLSHSTVAGSARVGCVCNNTQQVLSCGFVALAVLAAANNARQFAGAHV